MCCRSSVVERILGKAEVVSSILTGSTIFGGGFSAGNVDHMLHCEGRDRAQSGPLPGQQL
jgi:hypothetical protein